MHDVIERGLENYLGGSADREVEIHLAQCERCRGEVTQILELSGLFGTLRTAIDSTPPLGFSQRVLRRVQEEKTRGFWSVFSIDPSLARKLALASLLSLIALGGFLASDSVEAATFSPNTPEAQMTRHDSFGDDAQQHRDGMLVTLATYHQ